MDKINFDNLGGQQIFQAALKFMQSAYSDCIAGLAAAIGVNVILSGCVRNGSTIGAGRMIVNGEVVPFAGGQYADYVTVQEADTSKQYNDGSVQQMYAQRSAVCTNVATGNVPLANFVTIQQLTAFAKLPTTTGNQYATANDNVLATQTGLFNVYNALKGQVPSGAIMMWGGNINNIPAGWYLCNGSNGTPDLRDRFIVGAGNSYGIGNTGGEAKHTLTVNELPAHNHSISLSRVSNGGAGQDAAWMDPGSFGRPTGSWNTDNAGGNLAHENRPPYYALAYIMKS